MSDLSPISEILDELRAGRMIVLVDDAKRENEGDLTLAAEKATPQAINFMLKEGRGLVCLTLTPEKADQLNLAPQTADNTSTFGTGFTVTIDAKKNVTTGVSAADRATTILTVASDDCRPEELARPGHIFPIRARKGGCLVRPGQTEGSVDLCRLAGLKPAGVICEIMNEDGTMARAPELHEFCRKHGLKMCAVEDVIRYRRSTERLVEHRVSCRLPTVAGEFVCHTYGTTVDKDLHLALCKGDIRPRLDGVSHVHEEPILVRVHSECLTGDALGSVRCDCRQQLQESMRMVQQAGQGVVLYMHQEGSTTPKSRLQEWVQREMNSTPVYRVTAETGPDHVKSFEVVTLIAGKPYGAGQGATKKAAEQMAAEPTLKMLGQREAKDQPPSAEAPSTGSGPLAESNGEMRQCGMNHRSARAKELYALLGDLPERDRPISCETMAEEEHPAYRLEETDARPERHRDGAGLLHLAGDAARPRGRDPLQPCPRGRLRPREAGTDRGPPAPAKPALRRGARAPRHCGAVH